MTREKTKQNCTVFAFCQIQSSDASSTKSPSARPGKLTLMRCRKPAHKLHSNSLLTSVIQWKPFKMQHLQQKCEDSHVMFTAPPAPESICSLLPAMQAFYTAQLKKVLHNSSQNKVDSFAAKSNMCMNGSQEYKKDPAGGRNRKACYKNKHPCVISASSFVSSLLCMNTSDGLLLSSGLVCLCYRRWNFFFSLSPSCVSPHLEVKAHHPKNVNFNL